MPRQLTVRNVPDRVAAKLETMSSNKGQSVNTTVLEILASAVGDSGRLARLARYVTWSEEDAASFQEALEAQRQVDADLWR